MADHHKDDGDRHFYKISQSEIFGISNKLRLGTKKKNFRLDLVLCVKNKGRNYGHNAVVSQAAQLDFDGSMINGCLG